MRRRAALAANQLDRILDEIVAEAAGSVSSYVLNRNGTLTTVSAAVANGQEATCWDAFSRGFLYAVNTSSSTISG